MANEVKESFLNANPIKVINNGIDLNVFKPTRNSFREKFALQGKKIILGVAFVWDKRKGIDVFIELSKTLDDSFQIVLVGTSKEIEKKLPHNIISIRHTQNQTELAEIYASADMFFNPTREDNYPTVNMESIACGTPVITYDAGGSAEMVEASCGIVLPVDCKLADVHCAIEHIWENLPQYKIGCKNKRQDFDENTCFNKYVQSYSE